MRVCRICREIVVTEADCARVDCPCRGDAPEVRSQLGLSGKGDRLVQTSLDRFGEGARETTRWGLFLFSAFVIAVVLVITYVVINGGNNSPEILSDNRKIKNLIIPKDVSDNKNHEIVSVDGLISRWIEAENKCRGGPGDDPETDMACEEREQIDSRLTAAGWCYGEPGQYGYEMKWHECK